MLLDKLVRTLLFGLALLIFSPATRAEDDATPEADATTSPKTAPTGELYSLSYKFTAGEEVRWQTLHRATIKTTIRGTTQTVQTSTDSFKRWEITGVSPEGEITFVHSVDQVKMINKIGNRAEIRYDSTKDKTPPLGFETVAAAIGVPLTEFQIDRHGKVTNRIRKLVQQQGTFETPITIPLPSDPVAVGATWDEPHQISVELSDKRKKPIAVRRRFELTEVNDNIAHIGVRFQVLAPLADPALEAQLIHHWSQGEIRFDIERGRVLSQAITIDKRVLGFSGPASSMHHLMQLNETLADATAEVATRPNPDDPAAE